MPKSDTELLSPGTVALMVRKSSKTVVRWGDRGLLGDVYETEGGQRRFKREAVEAFIAARAEPAA